MEWAVFLLAAVPLVPLLGMAQQEQERMPGLFDLDDMRKGWNLLTWVSYVHALPLEVFLRKPGTFGEKYFEPRCVLVCLIYFPAFGALGASWLGPELGIKDWAPHWWLHVCFGLFALIALACQKAAREARERKGHYRHSRDKGEPRLGSYAVEAGVCFLGGVGLCFVSPPLGLYLAVGGLALAFNQQQIDQRHAAQDRDARDAIIEQEHFRRRMEEWMGRRGGGR